MKLQNTRCVSCSVGCLTDTNLRLVLGHCGEGLPTAIDRTDHRMRHVKKDEHGAHQRELALLFCQGLLAHDGGGHEGEHVGKYNSQVWHKRIIYTADYPYEDMVEAAQWFDGLETDEASRAKLSYGDTKVLIGIK